jgi:hypothetical protein
VSLSSERRCPNGYRGCTRVDTRAVKKRTRDVSRDPGLREGRTCCCEVTVNNGAKMSSRGTTRALHRRRDFAISRIRNPGAVKGAEVSATRC